MRSAAVCLADSVVVALCLIAALVAGCGDHTDQDHAILPAGPIRHEGRWLVDASGRVLLLHGVNEVNKSAPYYPAAEGFDSSYADWLRDNGFRVVRVGILATGLMPAPGSIDPTYIAHVADTVHLLSADGIFSLLDFHQDGFGPALGDDGFPAWMTLSGDAVNTHTMFPYYYVTNPAIQQAFQSVWDDAAGPDGRGLQEDYAAMFAAVAQEFAADPFVIGYDLFNEPWPGTTWEDCLLDTNGCPTEDTGELAPLYAKAVQAIRAAGDPHLIFGEPFVLFNFGESATNIPLPGNDPESGLSFHMYTTDPSAEPAVLANALSWAQTAGGALLNTEWGATEASADIERQTAELNSALLPWIFWSLGEIVNSIGQPVSSSNLVPSTVQSLVQPYPLAVAGTPSAYSYSADDQVLQFSWSTTAPDGQPSQEPSTVFEVPQLVYPDGYAVTVTGGVVTSAGCPPLLTVTAAPDAQLVTVTIAPAAKCST